MRVPVLVRNPPTLFKTGVKGQIWQGAVASAIEPRSGSGLSQQEVRLRPAVEELSKDFAITPIH